MEMLCRHLANAFESDRIPPPLIVATFIFDLLCIHPFRDGNGRVSRLATTLLLESEGFRVGRYISVERIVEDTKEEYYRVLADCSRGWHEGENAIVPWWNYFLSVVRRAYRDLEHRLESAEAGPPKRASSCGKRSSSRSSRSRWATWPLRFPR